MTIARATTARSTLLAVCALCAAGVTPFSKADAGDGRPATRPAAPANTWVNAKLRFILPADIPDSKWDTGDGYSGATYRSKTGTVLWRTGVKSKAAGLSPGYYSNATLEWAPATAEARVIDVMTSWGGGSYGGGKLLAGFKHHPMPPPRHVYDAFDYIAGEDAVYVALGSYWKVGLSRSTPEAAKVVNQDKNFTWKYSFGDRRWHRIDHGVGSIYKNVTPHGAALQPWPEAGKILCFTGNRAHYAEFDLKTRKWTPAKLKRRFSLRRAGPGSSTWDSKRQLWVFRAGPKVVRLNPKTRDFDTLPDAYPMADDKRFKFNKYTGCGIAYIPRHDAYLIYCPNGNDTYVYQTATKKWVRVMGGDTALPFGSLVYDPKTDLIALVNQHKAFRFRYVPAKPAGRR